MPYQLKEGQKGCEIDIFEGEIIHLSRRDGTMSVRGICDEGDGYHHKGEWNMCMTKRRRKYKHMQYGCGRGKCYWDIKVNLTCACH